MTDENNNENTGENESTGKEWVGHLPEFARNWAEVQQAETMEALFNRFGEQRSYIGGAIRIPSDDASADVMAEFHDKLMNKVPALMKTPDLEDQASVDQLLKRLGRPEEATGYSMPEGEDLSFGEDQAAELQSLAHDLGLTKKQFEKFAAGMGKQTALKESNLKDHLSGEVTKLQEAWGLSAEAKFQETLNFAKQAGAPQALVDAISNKSADSETMMWLNNLAQGLGEKQNADFNANNSAGGSMTPDEAQTRITEILDNREHPYHSGDKGARGKMHDLMALANPSKNYSTSFG